MKTPSEVVDNLTSRDQFVLSQHKDSDASRLFDMRRNGLTYKSGCCIICSTMSDIEVAMVDLSKYIAEMNTERKRLVKQAAVIEDKINKLDAAILALAGRSNGAKATAPTESPSGATPGVKWADAIRSILSGGKRLAVADISTILINTGVVDRSYAGSKSVISGTLSRMMKKGEAAKDSEGRYFLASARPAKDHRPESREIPETVAMLAEKVLRRSGSPLHYKDITDRIRTEEGFEIGGKNPYATMSAHLSNNDDKFERVGARRGVYRLKEWAETPPKDVLFRQFGDSR